MAKGTSNQSGLLLFLLVVMVGFLPRVYAADCTTAVTDFTLTGVGSSCSLPVGSYSFDSFTLTGGAVVTVQYGKASDQVTTLTVTGSLSIDADSSLTSKGEGYDAATPGAPGTPDSLSGGGHGGNGGAPDGYFPGQGGYDTITNPHLAGAIGGTGISGGGVISINAGDMSVSGTIDASGADCSAACGGGAGGSIYITTSSLSGTGKISSNGGSGPATNGGGGGGGLVYVEVSTAWSFEGSITAYGGAAEFPGGAGFVHRKLPSDSGILFVSNGNLTSSAAITATDASGITLLGSQSVTATEIRVSDGASLGMGDLTTISVLQVSSNSNLTVQSYDLNVDTLSLYGQINLGTYALVVNVGFTAGASSQISGGTLNIWINDAINLPTSVTATGDIYLASYQSNIVVTGAINCQTLTLEAFGDVTIDFPSSISIAAFSLTGNSAYIYVPILSPSVQITVSGDLIIGQIDGNDITVHAQATSNVNMGGNVSAYTFVIDAAEVFSSSGVWQIGTSISISFVSTVIVTGNMTVGSAFTLNVVSEAYINSSITTTSGFGQISFLACDVVHLDSISILDTSYFEAQSTVNIDGHGSILVNAADLQGNFGSIQFLGPFSADNVQIYQTNTALFSGPVAVESLDIKSSAVILSSSISASTNLTLQGDSINITGTVATPIFRVSTVKMDISGTLNTSTPTVNVTNELTISGKCNIPALAFNIPTVYITSAAFITSSSSLNVTGTTLFIAGSLQTPVLYLTSLGNLTMGFTTTAPAPVISSTTSIVMLNSTSLNTTSLDIKCSAGATIFDGTVITTNLIHALFGDVEVRGVIQMGTHVGLGNSSFAFTISSTGQILANLGVDITGSILNVHGIVNTNQANIVTHSPSTTFGNSAKVISNTFTALGDRISFADNSQIRASSASITGDISISVSGFWNVSNIAFASINSTFAVASTLYASSIVSYSNFLLLSGFILASDSAQFNASSTSTLHNANLTTSFLLLQSSGSLEISQNSHTKSYTARVDVNSFNLGAASTLDVSGTSLSGLGTGKSTLAGVCSGATHGGTGGGAADDPVPYDSVFTPTQNGSVGCALGSGNTGGAGGGIISLYARGMCQIDGTLSSDGVSGSSVGTGGGSGGSVLIEANGLQGSGAITANGGAGMWTTGIIGGGGGGGRIAIYYQSLSYTGLVSSYGGLADVPANCGGPGTILYHNDISGHTVLVVDKGNASLAGSGMAAIVSDSLATLSFSEVILNKGAELAFSSVQTSSVNITVLSGDGTGTLNIASWQALNISTFSVTSQSPSLPSGFYGLPSSIVVYGNATLPSYIAILQPAQLDMRGTLCGTSKVMIYGGGTFKMGGGRTCGMPIGNFSLDVIVYANGTLTNATQNSRPTVAGQVCAFRGSVVLNVNTLQLWDETTSSSYGPCVDYVTTTSSTSTTSTTSTSTSTTGATSTSSTSTTGGTVPPGVPQNIAVNASRRYVIVRWTAPSNPSGLSLSYSIEVVNQTNGNWATAYLGPALTANITGLSPNTTHLFRIWATTTVNGSSQNFTAETKQLDPPSVSSAPSYRAYGRNYIVAQVQYPYDDGGLPVLNYTLSFSTDRVTWTNYTVTSPSNVHEFDNLTSTTTYYFKSSSFTALGQSPVSVIGNITTADRICGDGTCDSVENCTTCKLDCGACGYPACPGTPQCSNHGSCVTGICVCDSQHSGPDCNTPVTSVPPVVVDVNNTSPNIVVTPVGGGTGNQTDESSGSEGEDISVSFNIFFSFIAEIDSAGNTISNQSLANSNFTVSRTKLNLTDGNLVDQYEYFMSLANGGSISIFIAVFTNATSIEFANKTIYIPVNGIKYSMHIADWPFKSYGNKLQIAIQTDAQSPSGNECTQTQISADSNNNLRWIQVSLNGVILYGTFEEVALIDDTVKSVQYQFDTSAQKTIITVPHFWYNAVFDPDFQVLLDAAGPSKTECGETIRSKDGISSTVLIAVIAGAVGAIIIASVVGIVIMKKNKDKREARLRTRSSVAMKSTPILSNSSSSVSSSSSI